VGGGGWVGGGGGWWEVYVLGVFCVCGEVVGVGGGGAGRGGGGFGTLKLVLQIEWSGDRNAMLLCEFMRVHVQFPTIKGGETGEQRRKRGKVTFVEIPLVPD